VKRVGSKAARSAHAHIIATSKRSVVRLLKTGLLQLHAEVIRVGICDCQNVLILPHRWVCQACRPFGLMPGIRASTLDLLPNLRQQVLEAA
jgi:hypothetical protein